MGEYSLEFLPPSNSQVREVAKFTYVTKSTNC